MEFPKQGFRIICYTPIGADLFVGKVILEGECRITPKFLPVLGTIFVQAIIGKLLVHFDGVGHLIREGHYALLDGRFAHYYENPQTKESSFLLVTNPSFLVQPVDLN